MHTDCISNVIDDTNQRLFLTKIVNIVPVAAESENQVVA